MKDDGVVQAKKSLEDAILNWASDSTSPGEEAYVAWKKIQRKMTALVRIARSAK